MNLVDDVGEAGKRPHRRQGQRAGGPAKTAQGTGEKGGFDDIQRHSALEKPSRGWTGSGRSRPPIKRGWGRRARMRGLPR